jgi:signal transduction histidine kinase
VVAAGTASDAGTLARLRVLVLVAAVLAAVVAGVAALLLTRRALRPLHRLSEAAAGIERTGDATRRLPQPTHRDEVAELAATLNGMLASLQQAGERERRFVADASHELRTPVTALRGNIDYVADHGADAAVLADLQHDVARLAALLDDLLALARVDAGAQAFAPVRLDEVARGVAERPQVHVDVPGPVLVHGDRAALERALRNLVENAERYGPPGGRIDVRVRQQGTSAVLTVQDAGAGVPPADAERVFERFWRGEGADRPPGSGLGLAIVRATAERHRGRASVQGSTFALELPAQDGTGR